MEGGSWRERNQRQDAGSPDDRLLPTNLALWGQQDIAIAAFLMLLWRDMYPAREGTETGMEWDKWGRPPGGLVDLGCGNGLVVHILVSEVSSFSFISSDCRRCAQ